MPWAIGKTLQSKLHPKLNPIVYRLPIANCQLPTSQWAFIIFIYIGGNLFSAMKNNNVIISVALLLLIFVVFIIRRFNEPLAKETFDRHPKALIYTKHALCRMDCRHIDGGEIKEIMEKGSINFNKSNKRDQPCPTFAVQGRTAGGESIRVIFGQCDNETKVITCYNLDEDFECHCPGDPLAGPGQAKPINQ